MSPSKKAAALAAGFVAVLTVVSASPRITAQVPRGDQATLVVEDATVDWIEKSNIAALRDGVIEKMELQIGMPVAKGKPIGYLHREIAELSVKKAQVAVDRLGPQAKAAAQKELAAAVVARNIRLNARIPGSVSPEEVQKAEAEFKVAHALTIEAQEQLLMDKAELELAKQAYEEHTIRAPFDGIVIERMKNEGEKIGQAEAVVQLGNLSRLRAYAYVPAEYAFRVKVGQAVDLQPRLAGTRNVPLPIEQKKFRGKITFVDPQIQPVAETAVRIYAEFPNPNLELGPGLKGSLSIYLGTEPPAPAGVDAGVVGAATSARVDPSR
ncbi:MAG: efflux RND transporter periplasmic adaptor subunit [Isosphaeraceae bacterium]